LFLEDFGRNSAWCDAAGGEVLEALQRIIAPPDPSERHACECGHPEMWLLPDNVYR
jgi:hypothetical protein